MKFIPYLLVLSLFVFSCNNDDDSNDPGYKSGWSEELITLSAKECENSAGGDFDTCLCATKETAKLFTLTEVFDGLSAEQEEELSSAVVENCGIEFF